MLLEEQRGSGKGGARQRMFTMGHCNTVNMNKRLETSVPSLLVLPLDPEQALHKRPPKDRESGWQAALKMTRLMGHVPPAEEEKVPLLVCPARREN